MKKDVDTRALFSLLVVLPSSTSSSNVDILLSSSPSHYHGRRPLLSSSSHIHSINRRSPSPTTSPPPSLSLSSSTSLVQSNFMESVTGVADAFPAFVSEGVRSAVAASLSGRSCGGGRGVEDCRDEAAAFPLKMVALAAILVAGAGGVVLPLVGSKWRFLRTESGLFVAAKAFAAGVILATGFIHMLPDGSEALTNPCLPKVPWSKFPFSEFIAMVAALGTLLADFLGTQFYERKHEKVGALDNSSLTESLLEVDGMESGIVPVVVAEEEKAAGKEQKGEKVFGEDAGGGIHIVGIRAHAAAHSHSHSRGNSACVQAGQHHHHDEEGDEGLGDRNRHVLVSQILELGIVSHSVIIGLSLGVSQSPCTIQPLIAALSFHQFFEGFALGGCISQAQFATLPATLMACFFAITTPLGISIGTGVSSFYNPKSPRALVVEGVLDSISAGILVYMAMVDLIAADFLSKKMRCNPRLQMASYIALFIGAGLMSSLAIWA